MSDDPVELVNEVRETYEDVIQGPDSRIDGGDRLWSQYQSSVDAVREGREGAERQMRERVNELATAKFLADDGTIVGQISYEPDILPSGRKIDFVVDRPEDKVFVEVKSVYPDTPDTEASW